MDTRDTDKPITRRGELRRLHEGPSANEFPGIAGTDRLIARCSGDAAMVLARTIEVLSIVLSNEQDIWPTISRWRELLPLWFVQACADEQTPQQAEQWLSWWRGLSPNERARAEQERRWTVQNWIYWLQPEQREWWWWDSKVLDANTLLVEVQATDWPHALGALTWLLRAAGAIQVTTVEN